MNRFHGDFEWLFIQCKCNRIFPRLQLFSFARVGLPELNLLSFGYRVENCDNLRKRFQISQCEISSSGIEYTNLQCIKLMLILSEACPSKMC